MPAYKKGKFWYFSFSFKGKRYKREKFEGEKMLTKAQCLLCERKFRLKLEEETREDARITLSKAWDNYFESIKPSLKISTHKAYRTFKRGFLSWLEIETLKDLSTTLLEKWYARISEYKASAEYKNKALSKMQSFITYCISHYSINPSLLIVFERRIVNDDIKKPDGVIFNEAMFKKFISTYDNGDYRKYIFELLHYTGMRIGELASLTFGDYNEAEGILNVSKNFIKITGDFVISTPKSINSTREVYLDEVTNNEMKYYVKVMKEIYKPGMKDFLFGIKKPICQQRIRENCKKHCAMAGLPPIKLHGFRHSHATELAKMGVEASLIANRIGDTTSTVQDVYINPLKEDSKILASKIRKK